MPCKMTPIFIQKHFIFKISDNCHDLAVCVHSGSWLTLYSRSVPSATLKTVYMTHTLYDRLRPTFTWPSELSFLFFYLSGSLSR